MHALQPILVFLQAFRQQVAERGLVFSAEEAGWEELLYAELQPTDRERVIAALLPEHFRGGPFCGPASLAHWDFEIGHGARVWEVRLASGHPQGPAICLRFRRRTGQGARRVSASFPAASLSSP